MGKKSFSKQDQIQLKKQGISLSQAEAQLQHFRKGFPFVELIGPCTVGKGIFKLSQADQKRTEKKFKTEILKKKGLKFVPASGAASRMFQFLEDSKPESVSLKKKFLKHLPDFAFYQELNLCLKKKGQDLSHLRKTGELKTIVQALLEENGLGYRQAPKGMILFHREGKKAITAFEEQLSEGLLFADAKNKVYLHFTLPESARKEVSRHLKKAAGLMRGKKFILSDSIQSPSTNCLASEKNHAPVRDDKGHLLLRPAGHGALLQNLNQIKADLIYVKNIDNILPKKKRGEADRWKKILSGFFLEIQDRIFAAQKILIQPTMTPTEVLSIIRLAQELGWEAPKKQKAKQSLQSFFNRPLRVCGMVPNTGEPGGGPFWIRDHQGNVSAQVVESAEVNFKNKQQEKIWRSSSHFNPVDFVCGVYDFRGKKYDLQNFSDVNRGLITKKNYHGREIQVMELPGLWNGSMANWISVFVEIPVSVFSPVKTVLDLLRSEHQPGGARKK